MTSLESNPLFTSSAPEPPKARDSVFQQCQTSLLGSKSHRCSREFLRAFFPSSRRSTWNLEDAFSYLTTSRDRLPMISQGAPQCLVDRHKLLYELVRFVKKGLRRHGEWKAGQ